MKLIFSLVVILSFIIIFVFIKGEEGKYDIKPTKVENISKIELDTFHNKFSKIDMNSNKLDLSRLILEIKEARKIYPLDDKLKMIDIELEHKRANKPN